MAQQTRGSTTYRERRHSRDRLVDVLTTHMKKSRLVVSAVLVLSLVGCGGGASSDEIVETPSKGSDNGSVDGSDDGEGFTWEAECVTPTADLPTEGLICADSGMRPVTDGFSFENWGGPVAEDAVTLNTAAELFGVEAVCAEIQDDTCTPLPAAQQWVEMMNESIEGGRCEGMAVVSQRMTVGLNTPGELQEGATLVADLQRDAGIVGETISRWWVTQALTTVQNFNYEAQQLTPTQIAEQLVVAIRNQDGVTLGFYSNGSGHAVTPIAVAYRADGILEVLNYDNNYPGQITTVIIDPSTETWSYDMAATNADVEADIWSGSTGTMDFTLMSVREEANPAPWSEDDQSGATKGSARITISTRGRSVPGALITVGSDTIDTRDLSTVSNGIRVFPSRGSRGTGAIIEIPAGLDGVKIVPVIGDLIDTTATEIPILFAVDAPGSGSLLVRDTVDASDTSYDDFVYEVSTGDDFVSSVDVAPDGAVEAAYAFGEELVEALLEDGQDLDIVDPAGEEAIDVAVTDEDGTELFASSFDGVDDDGTEVTELDFNEDTGEMGVSDVPLDDEILSGDSATGDGDGATDDGSGDAGDGSGDSAENSGETGSGDNEGDSSESP